MRTLLVANRGEIARRIFRTAREMGIGTVAVFSDADADAPFVREADAAVRLAGDQPADTYLRGDLVVAAAVRTGADAVHPGYGFLSESSEFAQRVIDAGLTWVGPPAAAIAAMGSKLEAKRLMHDAGVPTLPWATDVNDAAAVGYPLLVKASGGGGGRGMRVVRDPKDLPEAVRAAQREAGAAFGDDTVFLERYLDAPRHVELQVFADSHGTTVSLFERECSIQRRHQKVLEESPSPAVSPQLRAEMGAAAVVAARTVGYVGAGTVEFVLAPDGTYYFLEMNTRLQVEHPVTELVTGLDLVRLQLLVADGHPLPPVAAEPVLSGHAIEVRLYAEDPRRDFLPVTGRLRSFELGDGVRVDSGVEPGGVVSPFYDSMLAKVISHGTDREAAAATLADALHRARIHGVTTNRDLLVRVLREPEFLAGATDTAYLERHDLATLAAPLLRDDRGHLVAAVMALQQRDRDLAPVLPGLPSGWRNNPSQPQRRVLEAGGGRRDVTYRLHRDGLAVAIDGEPVPDLVVDGCGEDLVVLTVNGVRRRYDVAIDARAGTVDVDSAEGSASYTVVPPFVPPADSLAAGSLVAPMPGSVVRVLVAPGDPVTKGQPLVVLEAMKMEHTVASPADGTVTELVVAAGQQVDAGAVLALVDEAPESDEATES